MLYPLNLIIIIGDLKASDNEQYKKARYYLKQ